MAISRSIKPEDDPEEFYKSSKNLLLMLHPWFFGYFVKNPEQCIINLPVAVQVDNSTFYSDTIDIVSVGNKIKLFDFKQISSSSYNTVNSVYSDIEVMTRIWGFKKATDYQVAEYCRIYILPKSIQMRNITITDKYREKINKIINYLLRGISSEVFYQSKSDHCNRCVFSEDCKL